MSFLVEFSDISIFFLGSHRKKFFRARSELHQLIKLFQTNSLTASRRRRFFVMNCRLRLAVKLLPHMKNKPATYDLSIPDGATWVHVEVHGSVTIDTMKAIAKETTDLIKEHGFYDFFYDGSDSSSAVSIFDQYQVVTQDLATLGFDRRSKIAVLISAGDSSRDFAETALRNAGYICRLFTDRDEATSWLSQSEKR